MRHIALSWTFSPVRRGRDILVHQRGGVLVEAAFALPLMILLLLGILLYGCWFMTAHTLQQAANDAARSAVAGLTDTERRALVDQSVAASKSSFPLPGAQTIGVTAVPNSGYYTVTLTYNLSNAPIFSAAPFPIPASQIKRSAVIRIAS